MYRMLISIVKKKYLALLLVLVTLGYFVITTNHHAKAQTVTPSIVPTEITPSPTPIQSGPIETSSNYFLKIDGAPGESTDAKHKGEIDILSFQWGETQPGSHA